MTTATVTQVPSIPHNDPDAAPFRDGFRWSFSHPDLGTLDGYAATRDEAEGAARRSAMSLGMELTFA